MNWQVTVKKRARQVDDLPSMLKYGQNIINVFQEFDFQFRITLNVFRYNVPRFMPLKLIQDAQKTPGYLSISSLANKR